MSDNEKDQKTTDETQVALVQDPFEIPTIRISEAQESSDELVLENEQDLDLTDKETLANLAHALEEESQKHWEEMQEIAGEMAEALENPEERLAREIAEDEALEKEMAEAESAAAKTDPELQAALPQSLDVQEMQSCIEALLFMADRPLSTQKLRELLGPDFPLSIFQEALTELKDRYQSIHHGFELVEISGGYQFRTKVGRAALAKKLAKVQTQRLSSGAMETLAIVAYRQPVMKDEIDKVRGVDSSHFIRTLLEKKLIRISGRSELPGRPMLYNTTQEFLELFGLKSLDAMPPLRELEQMAESAPLRPTDEADPRIQEMRRLVGEMKANHSKLAYDPSEDEKFLSDIRQKVSEIPTSTPYLDAQKEAEKAAAKAAQEAEAAALTPEVPAEPQLAAEPQLVLAPELPVAPEVVPTPLPVEPAQPEIQPL